MQYLSGVRRQIPRRAAALCLPGNRSCYTFIRKGGKDPISNVPVTLLAGFLGAGKTSTLTGILQNRAGLNVAVIVNDVASVNIDGATVRAQIQATAGTDPIELLELENGCVCCGPQAGELASSIDSLIDLGVQRGSPFDHVLIEMSGVADPAVVKQNLALGGVDVTRVVTLVDAPAFSEQWMTLDVMAERVGVVAGRNFSLGSEHEPATPLATATDLEQDPCSAQRRVVSLLLSQIEAADVVALNKVDMATEKQLATAMTTCSGLTTATQGAVVLANQRTEDATILSTTFGAAPIEALLPPLGSGATGTCEVAGCNDPSHDHSHSHGHSHAHSSPQGLDTTVDALGIDSFVFSSGDRRHCNCS